VLRNGLTGAIAAMRTRLFRVSAPILPPGGAVATAYTPATAGYDFVLRGLIRGARGRQPITEKMLTSAPVVGIVKREHVAAL